MDGGMNIRWVHYIYFEFCLRQLRSLELYETHRTMLNLTNIKLSFTFVKNV